MKLDITRVPEIYAEHIINRAYTDLTLTPVLMTVTFADPLYDSKQSYTFQLSNLIDTIKYGWKCYDRFHRHLCSRLTTNFTRKLHLMPQTYDFIDFPHTRHQKYIGYAEPTKPHIHSIYLVHSATWTKFETLMKEHFRSIIDHPSMVSIIDAHAVPFDPRDTEDLTTYAAKFLRTHNARAISEDVDLYRQSNRVKSDLRAA